MELLKENQIVIVCWCGSWLVDRYTGEIISSGEHMALALVARFHVEEFAQWEREAIPEYAGVRTLIEVEEIDATLINGKVISHHAEYRDALKRMSPVVRIALEVGRAAPKGSLVGVHLARGDEIGRPGAEADTTNHYTKH